MAKETGAREGLKGWLNPAKYGKFGIERFLIMNGLKLDQKIPTGTLVKVIGK